nr:PREDICTED: kunitz-type serine protease inhibitor B6-like [Anolis carolinensis]|eukprot:XP_016853595.1 PREDICTED: kunitz-type serine protease inhibitor B6-like [Anolis carolinensis]
MKSHHVALLLLGFFTLGTEPIEATLRRRIGKMEAHDKPPTLSLATFQDICLFPPEEGHCRGNMPRFFFNSTSRRCEKFIYGGCSGNGNNFETREECHQVCSRREYEKHHHSFLATNLEEIIGPKACNVAASCCSGDSLVVID